MLQLPKITEHSSDRVGHALPIHVRPPVPGLLLPSNAKGAMNAINSPDSIELLGLGQGDAGTSRESIGSIPPTRSLRRVSNRLQLYFTTEVSLGKHGVSKPTPESTTNT